MNTPNVKFAHAGPITRQIILDIARECLSLDTLEMRGRDSLDFHDHGVASIADALIKAYAAGAADALSIDYATIDMGE